MLRLPNSKQFEEFLADSKRFLRENNENFRQQIEFLRQTEQAEAFVKRIGSTAENFAKNASGVLATSEELLQVSSERLLATMIEPQQFSGPILQSITNVVHEFVSEPKPKVDYISKKVPETVLGHIFSFLGQMELGRTRQCSKSLHRHLDPMQFRTGNIFWRKYWETWSKIPLQSKLDHHHLRYLKTRLAYERSELLHWQSVVDIATCVKRVDKGLIVDLSGNVGKFADPKIALAISRRRPQALRGVIVTNSSAAYLYRQASPYSGPASFMEANTPLSAAVPRPAIVAEGFLGYALDLIELRPHEQALRDTVLACYVYRDLTVWKTLQHIQDAKASGAYVGDYYCALDSIGLPESCPRTGSPIHTACAWGQFRPRIRDVDSPPKLVKLLSQRVTSLELALSRLVV
jgi:hypothetical protein